MDEEEEETKGKHNMLGQIKETDGRGRDDTTQKKERKRDNDDHDMVERDEVERMDKERDTVGAHIGGVGNRRTECKQIGSIQSGTSTGGGTVLGERR